MTLRGKIAMTLTSAALLLSIAGLSQLRVTTHEGGAIVRLSWRTEAINVEVCRTLSAEELARVPAHMRQPEECTGRRVDYQIVLDIDGTVAFADTVSPAGARRDRPVYVFHDEAVAAGTHDVRVVFTALVPDDHQESANPVVREWTGSMVLDDGQIGLVTLDEEGGRLMRRQ